METHKDIGLLLKSLQDIGILSRLHNLYTLISHRVDLNLAPWMADKDNKIGEIIRIL